MYSIRAILDKEPATIASAVRTIVYVLVLAGIISLGEELLAGVALGVEALLLLFVRSQSTSKTYPTLAVDTVVSVAGSEDTVVIAATPPGPTGVEGSH